jgi:hypothetical protein
MIDRKEKMKYVIERLESIKKDIGQGIEFNYLKAYSDTGVNIWRNRVHELTAAIKLLKEYKNE